MARIERDEIREHRIESEIVVDAFGEEEQALGWYYYLQDRLDFPFRANCISERRISPLGAGEAVQVIGMAPEEDCVHDMFVEVRWQGRTFGTPVSQLEGVSQDEDARQAIEDWQYWIARSYRLWEEAKPGKPGERWSPGKTARKAQNSEDSQKLRRSEYFARYGDNAHK